MRVLVATPISPSVAENLERGNAPVILEVIENIFDRV